MPYPARRFRLRARAPLTTMANTRSSQTRAMKGNVLLKSEVKLQQILLQHVVSFARNSLLLSLYRFKGDVGELMAVWANRIFRINREICVARVNASARGTYRHGHQQLKART